MKVSLNDSKTVEMVVNSGANVVSLPWKVAVEMGLNPASGKHVGLQGADGTKHAAWKVIIPTLRVGGAVARNVECVVDPPEYADAPLLLGKSFLKHFRWELDKGRGKLVFSKALDDEAELSRQRR